jgi:uncharacterized protein
LSRLPRRAPAVTPWIALCLLLAAAGPAAAAPAEAVFPEPSARVVDAAGLLSTATRAHLDSVCAELAEKTGAEIGVALVPSIAPLDIETYSGRLFERWGVGRRQQDDGVLFVLARDERRVRIEVGYGLEGLLPDGRVGGLLRSTVVPSLRRDDWDAGVTGGVEALAAIVAADRGVTLATLGDSPRGRGEWERPRARSKWRILALVLFILLGVIVLAGVLGSATAGRPYVLRRGAGRWGGGFGSFGGFGGGGGGFGGFGGGASGGGGASSSF